MIGFFSVNHDEDCFLFTWALIFLIGVAPPDPVDLDPVDSDLKHLETLKVKIFFIMCWSSSFS